MINDDIGILCARRGADGRLFIECSNVCFWEVFAEFLFEA